MKTWLIGYFGEKETANYLRERGYVIECANYRTRFGEIDIIARKKDYIVFVEVKTRASGEFARPADYVGAAKRDRMKKTALEYLAKTGCNAPARFDVAEVYYKEGDGAPELVSINHIENAF